jgi:hypothetical protein
MKKFGTPIGLGPGSESENVGFDGLGTPLPEGRFEADCFLPVRRWWALPLTFVVAVWG